MQQGATVHVKLTLLREQRTLLYRIKYIVTKSVYFTLKETRRVLSCYTDIYAKWHIDTNIPQILWPNVEKCSRDDRHMHFVIKIYIKFDGYGCTL